MFKKITKLSQSLWPIVFPNPGSIIKKRAQYRVIPQIESLEDRWNPSTLPTMFDVNQGGLGSWPESMVDFHGNLFFPSNDGTHGLELWKTDGTTGETQLVKDINPGEKWSLFRNFFKSDNFLYFKEGFYEGSVWRTDGTTKGTTQYAGLFPSDQKRELDDLVNVGDTIYCSSTNTDTNEVEFWKSDEYSGNPQKIGSYKNNGQYEYSAVILKVLNNKIIFNISDSVNRINGQITETRSLNIDNGNITALNKSTYITSGLEFNKLLYFVSISDEQIHQLWKTDGTFEGTHLVKDLNIEPTFGSWDVTIIQNQGFLYFMALKDGQERGYSLWKSDGTPEGTIRLRDFDSIDFPDYFYPFYDTAGMTALGPEVFFPGLTKENGYELWKTDGTTQGTQLVRDINPGSKGSFPYSLTTLGNEVYFFATDENGLELWKTDGKTATTIMVKDIRPGPLNGIADDIPLYPPEIRILDGFLFFPGNDGPTGANIWKSDGTESGTNIVKNINPKYNQSSYPSNINKLNGKLIFTAADQYSPTNLFSLDGNAFFKDRIFNSGTILGNFTFFLDKFFFIAQGADGPGLWSTDGTPDGTVLVSQIGTKRGNGSAWMTVVNGMLFFAADDGFSGAELWKSDGTKQGTIQVKDIFPGPESGIPWDEYTNGGSKNFQVFNGILFFIASDEAHGAEIWRTDGTETGTYLVKDINIGPDGAYINTFTIGGNFLFFAANQEGVGYKLWRTDGTDSGTVPILNSDPNVNYGYVTGIRQIGDSIFFNGGSYFEGSFYQPGLVWKTDGFTGPAHIALDIRLTYTNFIPFHGKYLFVGKNIDGNNFYDRLFITDGTMENTVPLKDLPGIYFWSFFDYAIIDDTFYFWDGGLWKSDGTPEGTVLVKRIPSDLNFGVKSFVELDHKLYFRVIDSKGDPLGFLDSARNDIDTLWVSDGTFTGTRPVAGFSTREGFSSAAYGVSLEMSAISGQLFFMANDGFHGNELWRMKAVPDFSFTSFPFSGTNGVFEGYFPDWQSNYIDGLYKTILNRPADKPALRHWIGLLSVGFSRDRIAQAILESPEYRWIQVDSYYQRFLGRQADAQGRRAWINQLLSGVDEREVVKRFLNSPEYLGRFGDNVSFLQGVYQNLLGRSASVSEVRHWDELLHGRLNRNQVIKLIVHSEEAISNEIQSIYNNFLHRNIDSEGKAMVKRVVQQKSSFKEILKGIFSSPEFHHMTTV